MDNVIWLARNPRFGGDPLSQVRSDMRRAREAVGLDEEGFARLLQGALPGRTITGPIVRAWESKPPPPPGDVLRVALGLLNRDPVAALEDGESRARHAPDTATLTALLAVPSVELDRLQAAAMGGGGGVDRRVAEDLSVLTEE